MVLTGAVTYQTAMQIRADSMPLLGTQGALQIVIQDITTFDSAFVALLLFWQRWCTKRNMTMTLRIKSRPVILLLQAYQVTDLFTYSD
jgi:ABC-type transporter Mla MlaB component